jgi:hypothetical protein
LSKYLHGSSDKHSLVRNQVVNYLFKGQEILGDQFEKWNILTPEFKKKHLIEMLEDGTDFGVLEL